MILILGDGGAWASRLLGVADGFLTFVPQAVDTPTGPVYGHSVSGDLVFFLQSDAGSVPLSALTLSLADADSRISEVVFLLRQFDDMAMAKQLAETRSSRLHRLWRKTRQRYRSYTKTMQAKLWLDPLTRILNRDGVSRALSGAVDEAKATDAPMTFLLLDLDWFKRINDGYGHAVGDIVLRHVAGVLKDGVRRTDAVGRVGGEEFCAVLHGCDRDAGVGVAEKIRLEVASWRICVAISDDTVPSVWAILGSHCHVLSGTKTEDAVNAQVIDLTISVGVATFPDDFMSNGGSSRLLQAMGNVTEADMLQYMADKALYQAKKEGRNRVAAYKRRSA